MNFISLLLRKRMNKTLIIGGGAAGLYASTLLPDAVILEGNEGCGRKLLLTGGGRCNYTHSGTVQDFLPHYHGSLPFVRKVLYSHTNTDIISHMKELGIIPSEENGKIFPKGGDAASVLKALTKHKPRIIQGKVSVIEKTEDAFLVKTDSTAIKAENIILATGGIAYPRTGSDGSGYHIATLLGHSVTPPHPALSALSLLPDLKEAEGVSTEITIKKGKTRVTGDAVITRRGISGPAAENFSYLLNGKEDIAIEFCKTDISTLRKDKGAMLLKNAIPLPPRLASALLGDLGNRKIASLSSSDARKAEILLSAFPCKAEAIAASAMSTAGGIRTSEINPDTMESKLCKGLYFAGDIIDVDADCGGYSLTWAFATAFIASHTIASL